MHAFGRPAGAGHPATARPPRACERSFLTLDIERSPATRGSVLSYSRQLACSTTSRALRSCLNLRATGARGHLSSV